MVSSSISTDAKVRELPCGNAMLLFSWMIAHADNLGRLRGEPFYLKAVVVPYVPDVTEHDVECWLAKMAELGLVEWYEVKGDRYVQVRGWANHQRLDRARKSDLPPPPPGTSGSPSVSSGDGPVSSGDGSGTTGNRPVSTGRLK